jgi:hypothetical protein
MHENSIATYREEAAAGRLSKRCSEIMEILERIGHGTDREILGASKYGAMGCIQPRISELIERGLLEHFDNTQDETTGKTVRVVRIADRALRNSIAGARRAQQREVPVRCEATPTPPLCESAAVTATGSGAVDQLAPKPTTCNRCNGCGRMRVPGSEPAVFSFCDELFGRHCLFAERRRRISGDPNHELSECEMEALAR